MSINFYALIGAYGPPVLGWLAGLLITTLALLVLNFGRRVIYRAALDYLEIRARLAAQEFDQQRRRLALGTGDELRRAERPLTIRGG